MFENEKAPAEGDSAGANRISSFTHNTIADSVNKSSAIPIVTAGSDPPDMRALAVDLARKGYHVFRLEYDDKIPKRGSRGFYEGTTDPEVVYSRWTCVDGSLMSWNIGIWTKGLCVPDFDPKDQTIGELAAAFSKEHGELPDSAVSKTPRGGRHLFLRCPKGTRVPNSAGKIFPGVDVRGDLGYVVAPGSHTEARTGGNTVTGDYTLVGGLSTLPPVAELAEAPMWLIEAAWRASGKSRAWGTFEEDGTPAPSPWASDAPEDDVPLELDTEAQIEEGRAWLRNEAPIAKKGEGGRGTTCQVIQHLGDIGLTPPAAFDLLTEPDGWDATKSEPPWCRDEHYRENLRILVRDMLAKRDRPLGSGRRLKAEDCFEVVPLDNDWRAKAPAAPPGSEGKQATCFALNRWPPIDPSRIPPREWLYGKYLIREFVSFTSAPGGLGKTNLSLVELIAMAAGMPLLGVRPYGRLKVAYWNGEDPFGEIQRRVAAVTKHYGIDQAKLAENFFFGSGREIGLKLATMEDGVARIAKPVAAAVLDFLQTNNIDVLIVDPFISSHSVPENDNPAIDLVVKEWGRIAGAANCAIGLVSHARKPMNGAARENTIADNRGAGSGNDGARVVRALTAMSETECKAYSVPPGERKLYFRVSDSKENMSPPANTTVWFKSESVPLGNATIDRPEDLVGVVTLAKLAVGGGMTADEIRGVQDLIAGGQYRTDVKGKPWAGEAIAEVLGLDVEVEEN